ncbi:MAG: histidine phosphatase family protein [Ktedonobacteraceae bacterium]
MQVYLIRHAQCELNVLLDDMALTRRLSRSAFNALLRTDRESPLTPAGVIQAQQLAQRLTTTPFDRLYTSPLPRAIATTAVLSEATGLTPQILDDLQELRSALLPEGTVEYALWRLSLLSCSRMLRSPASPDTFRLVYSRVKALWSQITSEPAEAIAVVSHSWLLRMLVLSLWNDRRWRLVSRDFANSGVSLVMSREEARKRRFHR